MLAQFTVSELVVAALTLNVPSVSMFADAGLNWSCSEDSTSEIGNPRTANPNTNGDFSCNITHACIKRLFNGIK